jgi:ferritin
MPALSKKIEVALNRQINQEMAGAYSYLAMAGFFEAKKLAGFASWMHAQRAEELEHAMRLFRYVLDRGGQIDLASVEKPRHHYTGVREAFETALELEQLNTKGINELYAMAVAENDYATQSHLQWFVDEQVEEEKSVEEVLGLLGVAGDDKSALLVLNRQLAERKQE